MNTRYILKIFRRFIAYCVCLNIFAEDIQLNMPSLEPQQKVLQVTESNDSNEEDQDLDISDTEDGEDDSKPQTEQKILDQKKPSENVVKSEDNTKNIKNVFESNASEESKIKEAIGNLKVSTESRINRITKENIILDYSISEKQKAWLKENIQKHKAYPKAKPQQNIIPPNLLEMKNNMKNKSIGIPTASDTVFNQMRIEVSKRNKRNFHKLVAMYHKLGEDKDIVDEDGNGLLMYGIYHSDYSFIRFLLHQSIGVNLKNKANISPLHYSVSLNQKDIALLLMQNGADVNAKDPNGQTPIFYAIYNDNVDIFVDLIKNGADLSVIDKNGIDIEKYIIQNHPTIIIDFLAYGGRSENRTHE